MPLTRICSLLIASLLALAILTGTADAQSFGHLGSMGRGFGHLGATGKATSGAAYLGQVATRSYVANNTVNSTTGWNARTTHFARTAFSNPQVGLANWYIGVSGETLPSGNTSLTVTGAIEYPAGTFTQLQWGGSASHAIPAGNTDYSDPAPVSIPNGATFWTRIYRVPGSQLLFPSLPLINTSIGDAVDNSNVDKSMSGTITSAGPSTIAPQAIIASTTKPSIGIWGSSRTTGNGETVTDATGDLGYARLFGGSFGYINVAVSGDTMLDFTTSSRRLALLKNCSYLWIDPGLNDLNAGGKTAAQVMGYLAILRSQWSSTAKIIVNDETTWTASSDSWSTDGGQTTEPFEAQRVLLNSSIAALTGYNQIVRVSTIEGHGANNSLWNNIGAGGILSTGDGVHGNTNDNKAVRDSGIFNPALVQ